MTEADLEVLSRFESVWERVLSGNAPEAAPRWEAWEPLLQGVYDHACCCRMLSRRTAGREKERLISLAREAKRVLGELQTVYFLETGDIFLTKENCNFASYTPYNLRKLWKNAINLAGDLQNAAEADGTPFGEAAETMKGQAEVLKGLIARSLQ